MNNEQWSELQNDAPDTGAPTEGQCGAAGSAAKKSGGQKMAKKTVEIEAASDKTKAIKYDGEWKTVTGKAAQFLKWVRKGPAEVNEAEDGKVIYVRNLIKGEDGNHQDIHPAPQTTKEDYWASRQAADQAKDLRISRHGAMNTAIEAVRIAAQASKKELKADQVLEAAIALAETTILPWLTDRPEPDTGE